MRLFISMLRHLISFNRKVSGFLNHLLPEFVRRDGNRFFLENIAPQAIKDGKTLWDVGGGAQPFLSVEKKKRNNMRVVGLDIDQAELKGAPIGAYDEIIVADLCSFGGDGSADSVICQATLEHVPNTAGAIRAISEMLNANGKAFIFAPCRNAAFARLNLLLPQRIKEKILYFTSPEVEDHQGFPAFYDKCTPREMEALFADNGLQVIEKHVFWMSSYFMVLTPVFILWRMWQGLAALVFKDQVCETFCYIVRKEHL